MGIEPGDMQVRAKIDLEAFQSSALWLHVLFNRIDYMP